MLSVHKGATCVFTRNIFARIRSKVPTPSLAPPRSGMNVMHKGSGCLLGIYGSSICGNHLLCISKTFATVTFLLPLLFSKFPSKHTPNLHCYGNNMGGHDLGLIGFNIARWEGQCAMVMSKKVKLEGTQAVANYLKFKKVCFPADLSFPKARSNAMLSNRCTFVSLLNYLHH